MLWYYAQAGQRQGPVEEEEIRRLIAAGQIGRADLVWKAGMPEWRQAGEIAELAASFQPAWAPPPPPPSPAPTPPYGTVAIPAPTPAPMSAPAPAAPNPAPYSPYTPPAAPLEQPAYGAAPFGAVTTTEYASFGARFAALLIDQLLLSCVSGPIGVAVGLYLAATGNTEIPPTANLALYSISLLIGWLYYAGMESSSRRATIGKSILNLRVTDLQGQPITFGRATGRYFGKILSALPLLLGYFLMISDERKQTWHDKMANCLVLRVPR